MTGDRGRKRAPLPINVFGLVLNAGAVWLSWGHWEVAIFAFCAGINATLALLLIAVDRWEASQ